MIYCKVNEDGEIKSVLETSDEELAKANGYTEPCNRKIVQVNDGSYKFADETTMEDFLQRLSDIKDDKILELKAARDSRETSPIEYNDHLFDFDEKSYSRITAAIYALDVSGGTIHWTTADNDTVEVSADNLRGVIASAAVRSNALHIKYRGYKERVNAAMNASEVRAVVWVD